MQLYNNELIAYMRIQIDDETFDLILVQINGIHEQYFGYGFQKFQAKCFKKKSTFDEDFFHITRIFFIL